MKIGLVGLGKMGIQMVDRLISKNFSVITFDTDYNRVQLAKEKGAIGMKSLEEGIRLLTRPRIFWMMVPPGNPVDNSIAQLVKLLDKGDMIIDGGNSNWKQSQQRAKELGDRGIHFIDCGTSGGIYGRENGYCLMIGGEHSDFILAEPIFKALAMEGGYLHCGPHGAGHFVKMVHNGIEYGMMQACAEGFEVLKCSNFKLDLHKISKVWQKGSVIRSWLLELLERGLAEDSNLSHIEGYVEDSGEGQWMVQTAMDLRIPIPVISLSLLARFQSRQKESFAMKLLAMLRNQFGGHEIKRK